MALGVTDRLWELEDLVTLAGWRVCPARSRQVKLSSMSNEIDAVAAFQFEDGGASFESLGHENGSLYWSARLVMRLLGYEHWTSFRLVVNKAIGVCSTIEANVLEHFEQCETEIDGRQVPDFKLSKFACYLVAMNGDSKKPEIARAQAYFAAIAQAFQKYIQSGEDIERVDIRSEIRGKEATLSGVAKTHGVENFAFFQNAGYRGLYNMSLAELRKYKGDPSSGKKPLLDFMGKRELAANLFRITETEAKIQNDGLQGQKKLEGAAFTVGQAVRRTMTDSGGPLPENLPLTSDIASIKGDLKRTVKGLKAKPNHRLPEPPPTPPL